MAPVRGRDTEPSSLLLVYGTLPAQATHGEVAVRV
jgi:hypothetical protein